MTNENVIKKLQELYSKHTWSNAENTFYESLQQKSDQGLTRFQELKNRNPNAHTFLMALRKQRNDMLNQEFLKVMRNAGKFHTFNPETGMITSNSIQSRPPR